MSQPYSIVLIGSGGVGKSSITLRFVYDDFQEAYDPTRADSYRKLLPDGHEVDILDTAGQEQYAAVNAESGEGFILVFALNDPSSLQSIPLHYAQLRRAIDCARDPPCLLVGNKSDLQREIPAEEVERVLKGIPGAAYLETSAKRNENIDAAFTRLISMIAKEKEEMKNDKIIGRKSKSKKKKKKSKSRCTIN